MPVLAVFIAGVFIGGVSLRSYDSIYPMPKQLLIGPSFSAPTGALYGTSPAIRGTSQPCPSSYELMTEYTKHNVCKGKVAQLQQQYITSTGEITSTTELLRSAERVGNWSLWNLALLVNENTALQGYHDANLSLIAELQNNTKVLQGYHDSNISLIAELQNNTKVLKGYHDGNISRIAELDILLYGSKQLEHCWGSLWKAVEDSSIAFVISVCQTVISFCGWVVLNLKPKPDRTQTGIAFLLMNTGVLQTSFCIRCFLLKMLVQVPEYFKEYWPFALIIFVLCFCHYWFVQRRQRIEQASIKKNIDDIAQTLNYMHCLFDSIPFTSIATLEQGMFDDPKTKMDQMENKDVVKAFRELFMVQVLAQSISFKQKGIKSPLPWTTKLDRHATTLVEFLMEARDLLDKQPTLVNFGMKWDINKIHNWYKKWILTEFTVGGNEVQDGKLVATEESGRVSLKKTLHELHELWGIKLETLSAKNKQTLSPPAKPA
jgi:hypothetical protein